MSTSGGALDSSITYLPFGTTRAGSVNTDKKFTGQRLDGTGLYYYGARYYDPVIGRFISADTLVQNPANPQSLNRYSYVANNPLKYTDPSGHYVVFAPYSSELIAAWELLSLVAPEEAGKMESLSFGEVNVGWNASEMSFMKRESIFNRDQTILLRPGLKTTHTAQITMELAHESKHALMRTWHNSVEEEVAAMQFQREVGVKLGVDVGWLDRYAPGFADFNLHSPRQLLEKQLLNVKSHWESSAKADPANQALGIHANLPPFQPRGATDFIKVILQLSPYGHTTPGQFQIPEIGGP